MSTTLVEWILDLPEQVSGGGDRKNAIAQDMAQQTINSIGGQYASLSNWHASITPDAVILKCDAPVEVADPKLIWFGQQVWERCCEWKLGTLGYQYQPKAAKAPASQRPWWKFW